MKPCVYVLRSDMADVFYIGSTVQLDKRVKQHLRALKTGVHHNCILQAAWNAYEDVGLYETLDVGSEAEARSMEQKLINKFIADGKCTNIGMGVSGGDNLTNNPNRAAIVSRMTDSIRATMALLTPEERIEKFGLPGSLNGMYGKTHTDEVREKLSRNTKGNSHAKGIVRTPEQRQAISEHTKNRVGDKNSFYGKNHSEETKALLAAQREGKITGTGFVIEVEGVEYPSYYVASKTLGISLSTIRWRCMSENLKFSGYKILSTGPTAIEKRHSE